MSSEQVPLLKPIADNGVSVDCVILGFDGQSLNVLLVKRTGEYGGIVYDDMKLPGSPISIDEDLDEAAQRVLKELTGLSKVSLIQFKAFGSKNRITNPIDVNWLESILQIKVDRRMVTIAYIALVKIDKSISKELDQSQAVWIPVDNVGSLAFDHNQILREAVTFTKKTITLSPERLFDLLPKKFTILQLRKLYETLEGEKIDPGNFYKKLAVMPYVVPLDEKEVGMPHRAARLYRFDKKIYKKKFND